MIVKFFHEQKFFHNLGKFDLGLESWILKYMHGHSQDQRLRK